MEHDVQSPFSLFGVLAHHSYKRDIFPLVFTFFYSGVIKKTSPQKIHEVEDVKFRQFCQNSQSEKLCFFQSFSYSRLVLQRKWSTVVVKNTISYIVSIFQSLPCHLTWWLPFRWYSLTPRFVKGVQSYLETCHLFLMCVYYHQKDSEQPHSTFKSWSDVTSNRNFSLKNSWSPMGHVPMDTTETWRCV